MSREEMFWMATTDRIERLEEAVNQIKDLLLITETIAAAIHYDEGIGALSDDYDPSVVVRIDATNVKARLSLKKLDIHRVEEPDVWSSFDE